MENKKKIFQKMINKYHSRKIIRNTKARIKDISKNVEIETLQQKVTDNYLNLWENFSKVKPSLDYLRCLVSISGEKKFNFVPDDIYYLEIEPVLNNRVFGLAYNDKNFFEKYLTNFASMFPTTLLRGSNGALLDANYKYLQVSKLKEFLISLPDGLDFIIKPATETGGGNNVDIYKKEGNNFIKNKKSFKVSEFIENLISKYKYNFVLQERIIQNSWFDKFNDSCTNIIRMYTYRSVKTNEVHILHSYFRYGSDDSTFEDYLINGGIRQGISSEGYLKDFLIGRYGERIELKPEQKVSMQIPKYDEISKSAIEIAKNFIHHRLLGFDFIVDNKGEIKLFEVNTRNIGMIHHQMINGPLFGKYTKEVITYCKENKKSLSLHFYV